MSKYLEHNDTASSDANYFLSRHGSTDTNESPFGSALATPNDLEDIDTMASPFEDIGKKLATALEEHTQKSNLSTREIVKTESIMSELSVQSADEVLPQGSDTMDPEASPPMRQPSNTSYEADTEEEDADMTIRTSGSELAQALVFPSSHASNALADTQVLRKRRVVQTDDNEDDITFTQEDYAPPEFFVDPQAFHEPLIETPAFVIPDLQAVLAYLTTSNLLKIVTFIPWCIAVGAFIVLFPRRIADIAFNPTYAFLAPPETPIRRFEHWAHHAMPHILIFIGAISVLCVNLGFEGSFVLIGWLIGQCILGWSDFSYDERIVLGGDDRQSVYLALFKSEDLLVEGKTELTGVKQGLLIKRVKREGKAGPVEEYQ